MSQSNGQLSPSAKRVRVEEDDRLLPQSSNESSQFDSSCDFDNNSMTRSHSPDQDMPLKLVKREDDEDVQKSRPDDDEGDSYEENTANGDDFGDDEDDDSEEEGLVNHCQQDLSQEQQQSLLSLMPELLAGSVSAGLSSLVLPSLLSRLQVILYSLHTLFRHLYVSSLVTNNTIFVSVNRTPRLTRTPITCSAMITME